MSVQRFTRRNRLVAQIFASLEHIEAQKGQSMMQQVEETDSAKKFVCCHASCSPVELAEDQSMQLLCQRQSEWLRMMSGSK
jgi:hypothetical protein